MLNILKKRLSLPQGIDIVEVNIDSSRNSFFSKLSELASTQINLEVTSIPNTNSYVVFAYSYAKDLNKHISKLYNNISAFRRSKIRKLKYWQYRGLYYIIALKSRCEFFEIAEENNVVILSPYVFDKGKRKYIVLGEKSSIEDYLDDILKYYGSKNVSYRYVDAIEHINKLLLRRSLLGILLDKLTDNELKILRLAYQEGYFNYPRKTSLESIGSALNLSKVTIDAHLRKALRKIVEELMRFMDL